MTERLDFWESWNPPEWLQPLWRRYQPDEWRRMFRYTAGSAICFVVSELTFVVLFAPHILGAKSSSVVASVAGIIPGYWLNRTWTWGRRHRSDFWREVVPYWVTAVLSAAFAALAIGAVNAATMNDNRAVRTVLNAATYMAVYGLVFVGKYLLFDRVLFPGRREPQQVAVSVAPESEITNRIRRRQPSLNAAGRTSWSTGSRMRAADLSRSSSACEHIARGCTSE
ncbi:MAG: GtrA family protein [Chloroflexi bacterium]|nr:GtrA family protein [Chloroflexota bacterium]